MMEGNSQKQFVNLAVQVVSMSPELPGVTVPNAHITIAYDPDHALAVDSRRFGSWADRKYRVAKAVECFGLQFGVHYPHEERPAGRGLRLSPLHDEMIKRGAVMGAGLGTSARAALMTRGFAEMQRLAATMGAD